MHKKSIIIWLLICMFAGSVIFISKQKQQENKAQATLVADAKQAELKKRYEKGAYVASESKLSAFETAKTIIYPGKSSFGDGYNELYDTTCFLYNNTATNQLKIKCTGLLFDDDDETNGDMNDIETEPRYGRYE
jgi:hypothetical protein